MNFDKRVFLYLIIILAIFFRFNNLNWDKDSHLHPDERFLTMVGGSAKIPSSFGQYLNPQTSSFNPVNIGYKFFVYGSFPLIFNKILAVILANDNYNLFTLQGRFLSALVDLLVVILVYKTAKLLFSKKNPNINPALREGWTLISDIPLYCAFFYAISVYSIQSSHFFTTDTFLNFFMLASFYFVLNSYLFNKYVLRFTFYVLLSAVFFGLALSCKISGLYILPLNLGVFFLFFLKEKSSLLKKIKKYLLFTIYYLLFVYLSLRLASPYYFYSANFFDLRLNEKFVASIQSLKYFSQKDVWYPPAVQWINKPWWGLLSTTFFAGLGPVNFIVMIVGMIYLIFNFQFSIFNKKSIRQFNNLTIFLILFWVVGYFVYQSLQFVKSIRYTIYLYPFYAIFGGVGISVISNQLNRLKSVKIRNVFLYVSRFTFHVLLLFWPLLFFTIYLHKNTRVEASEWIYKNLPNNAVILGEHWDDPLPLPVENNLGKNFQVELLPIFDPDTVEKWSKMKELLSKADYYVLSSNRGWGSIPTVPERYPLMSRYYQGLLSNNCKIQKEISGVCYKKIKEFLPYYYKFIRYPDSWIEETFTVYDHQTVYVYEKVRK